PTPTTSYMAVVVKAAVVIGMLRLLTEALHIETLVAGAGSWPELLFWLSALTLVGGNLGAVVQRNVKRMLAYSSIANAGFLLMGIGAASRLEAPLRGDAIAAVFYYILAYTASSSLALGSLIAAGSQGREAVSLSDLAGLGRRHPWIGIPFSLGVLSLMGLPPLAGFFSKYWVLLAAVRAGNDYLTLGIVAVLMSTVGAYYYLRVLVYLFMRTGEEGTPLAVPMRSGYVFSALLIASFFVLQMGITPSPYVRLSHEASKAWEPGPSKDESNNQQIAQASP
ncbi:MAG: proton-conducting transporter membrane subunit, partial [Deltaproteobacteria bacterium]|nr:proton-conducting transporter membrane subunit [Deltaproteobacteria bacterium]